MRRIFLLGALILAAGLLAQPGGMPSRQDGEWSMPGRDYANTRYSPLTELTAENVGRLRPVWSFSTGVVRGHEGQPLVVNNTLYAVTPYPNVLYAFDLTQPDYPLKWKYRPMVDPNALGLACCDAINRGVFYAQGRLVYNLLDGHTVAVDAATGKELWNVTVGDLSDGETMPMAPLVVGNRVIVGPSGGEFGIRGWARALDLATGKLAWTGYNTGPDADLLIKPGTFKPFYDRGNDLGVSTWPGETWKNPGAPVWGWLSYDAALDLVYYGVGNPGPYNPEQRPGDNKWSNSVLARRPADGSLIWAYQFTPHDNWDYDSNAAMILVDLRIEGRTRRALVHFDKNGFAYTMDRTTGAVLLAKPYVHVNWAKGIDLANGRPILDSSKFTGESKGNVQYICPSLEGGTSPVSPPAYSPRTGWFYVSTNNLCMDFHADVAARIRGTPFIGASTPYTAGPGGHLGEFIAWDATSGKKLWGIKEKFPVWSGVVATGGDLVFYGTLDGWLKAVQARTGALLWKFKLGSGIVGAPISYRGPDGKQYVAVYAGIGGDWALLSGDVRSDDPTDIRDPAAFIKDLGRYTSGGGMIWVFGL